MSDLIFRLDRATVVRPTGETVFRDLSWEIRDGQTWAVVGPVGSGKTTLTDVLLGRLRVTTGSADWPLLDRVRAAGRAATFPSDVIGRVAFKEESRLFSYGRHYYQQRFNFIEPDDDLTLDEYLRTGTDAPDAALSTVATRLRIEHLRPLSLIKLSNGQTRRARIAKALLAHPEVLILDEPFIGLDADGRREVADATEPARGRGRRPRPDHAPGHDPRVGDARPRARRRPGHFLRPAGELMPVDLAPPQAAAPATSDDRLDRAGHRTAGRDRHARRQADPRRRDVDRPGRRAVGGARAERVREDDAAQPDLRRPPAGVQQRRVRVRPAARDRREHLGREADGSASSRRSCTCTSPSR